MIKKGKYRHFKGREYEVLGIVKHSETLDDYVHYRALYDNKLSKEWVRPIEMFEEMVTLENGERVKRFEYLGKD